MTHSILQFDKNVRDKNTFPLLKCNISLISNLFSTPGLHIHLTVTQCRNPTIDLKETFCVENDFKMTGSALWVFFFYPLLLRSQVMFSISVTSKGCPMQAKSETIKIKPLGFTEEVEITLHFICECECNKEGIKNSQLCHFGNGTYECGACK